MPATNKTDCEREAGCWEPLPDPVYEGNVWGWSPKTREECESEKNPNFGFAEWKNMFKWTEPKWMLPTIRNLSWINGTVYPAVRRNKILVKF